MREIPLAMIMVKSRAIVALDVPEADRAIELAALLKDRVAMVKVGLEGFLGHGAPLVRRLRAAGVEVFLDLKLHDIPRTAGAAAAQIAAFDVRLVTVHAAGGPAMVAAVRAALPATTAVVAVTLLTSLDGPLVGRLGWHGSVAENAFRLGQLAREGGADGLVCSAHELAHLEPLGGVRVVPGVRPAGAESGDQRRVATAADAVRAGATWFVVGRPVLQAADPLAALDAINGSVA